MSEPLSRALTGSLVAGEAGVPGWEIGLVCPRLGPGSVEISASAGVPRREIDLGRLRLGLDFSTETSAPAGVPRWEIHLGHPRLGLGLGPDFSTETSAPHET